MIDIETERLILRLVPLAGLAATEAGDRAAGRRIIGNDLPEAWFDDSWVAGLRLKQWTENPDYRPWSMRAIGLRNTGQIIGNMNCHHEPMPFVLGGETTIAVELGYTIFEPWRRQGYASEAIRGFCRWASNLSVQSLILSISPENSASLGLAAKFAAVKIGSQIDEIDGPEDIYFARISKMNGG